MQDKQKILFADPQPAIMVNPIGQELQIIIRADHAMQKKSHCLHAAFWVFLYISAENVFLWSVPQNASRQHNWHTGCFLSAMEKFPFEFSPMLATLAAGLPREQDRYAFEFKWDGYRALCFWDGRRLK